MNMETTSPVPEGRPAGSFWKGLVIVLLLCAAVWSLAKVLRKTAPAPEFSVPSEPGTSRTKAAPVMKEGQREISAAPPVKFLREKGRSSRKVEGKEPPLPREQ